MNYSLRVAPGHLPPAPGAGGEVQRVIAVGGGLATNTAHPEVIPFEQMFRKIPPPGAYNPAVSQTRTITFDIGAFRPPPNQALLIYNVRPQVYYWSGIDAEDVYPADDRALATKIGYNLTVSGSNLGLLSYDLRPTLGTGPNEVAFTGVSDLFQSTQSPFGRGSTVLPQRAERYGAPQLPFTIVVQSNASLSCQAVIFSPLSQPVAFIEYVFQGVQASQTFVDDVMRLVKPDMRQP